jgi:hypothetical protein
MAFAHLKKEQFTKKYLAVEALGGRPELLRKREKDEVIQI